jgi:hypothetical protein
VTPHSTDNAKLISSASSNNVGGGSGTGGAVLGDTLPATGVSLWLFMTVANILMFLLGLYLRLRAGRSPCAYATR